MIEDILILDFWYKILTVLFCATVLGIERKLKRKSMGVRTSIIICLGSMLFIYLGSSIDPLDSSRVLSQLVTGIGFLGAGVIMNRQGSVVGLTTASQIWLLAGIGAAIGFGHYAVAITITLVSLSVITFMPKINPKI